MALSARKKSRTAGGLGSHPGSKGVGLPSLAGSGHRALPTRAAIVATIEAELLQSGVRGASGGGEGPPAVPDEADAEGATGDALWTTRVYAWGSNAEGQLGLDLRYRFVCVCGCVCVCVFLSLSLCLSVFVSLCVPVCVRACVCMSACATALCVRSRISIKLCSNYLCVARCRCTLVPTWVRSVDEVLAAPARSSSRAHVGTEGLCVPVGIACGSSFTAVVMSTGELYLWGLGPTASGGPAVGPQRTPARVEALVSMNLQVACVACGGAHVVAQTAEGRLYAWGAGGNGRLGLGPPPLAGGAPPPVTVPTPVAGLPGARVTEIACGEAHNVALCDDGAVYTWGAGVAGQLGRGAFEDAWTADAIVGPAAAAPIVSISAGMNHTAVIALGGTLYTTGWGEHGRLGLGDKRARCTLTVVPPAGFTTPPRVVSCGGAHSLVLCGGGEVYSFGWGAFGQLGYAVSGGGCQLRPRRIVNAKLDGARLHHSPPRARPHRRAATHAR
jgi:hypothetical protein